MQYSSVTPEDVASLFLSLGLKHGQIRQNPDGWSSWTFEVEHEGHDEQEDHDESFKPGWIFRFPRNSVVAANQQKEIAILPTIASPRVDFAVPRFEHVGFWNGQPYVGYRRIPGRPLSHCELTVDTARSVATVLSSLHSIPTSLVATACAMEPSVDAWRRHYRALREEVRTRLSTLLESSILVAVELGFDRFFQEELTTLEDVALVHCDLGCEHILMDEEGVAVAGVIDFEDVTVGDPAIDFVGLFVTYGLEATERVRDYYGRELDVNFENRLYFYTWMASCHQIIYGLEEGRSELVEDGIAGLRTRLGNAGLL